VPSNTRTLLERQAALARAREAEARAEAEALEAAIARLTAARDALERLEAERPSGGLSRRRGQGTLGTVQPQEATPGSKVSKAKTKSPWPFSRALHAHGSSPAQWAAVTPGAPPAETVRAWLKAPGKGGRPCPREWADKIEAEFANTDTPVPARDSSWPNKIR